MRIDGWEDGKPIIVDELSRVPQGEGECSCRICMGIPAGEFWTDQCCTKVVRTVGERENPSRS